MRKWLNWVALVVVFSVACGFLSNWQFSRRELRLAAIDLVRENYDKKPVNLAALVLNHRFSIPEDTWRSVTVTGHYLPDALLLVRNRPNNGVAGFEELVPFVSTTGDIVYVSRGWMPSGENQDSPDEIPVPTNEIITLTGKILKQEPQLDRGAPRGQLASINIQLANRQTGLERTIENGYLRLETESPWSAKRLTPMPEPSIEEGNNLSYAMQWILFGLMAISALVWRIRRDRVTTSGKQKPVKKTLSDLDAEFEDSKTGR